MSAKDLQKEGFLTACKTIQALKGTVECLQINLSQERDNNEGLNLTIESLRNEIMSSRKRYSSWKRSCRP